MTTDFKTDTEVLIIAMRHWAKVVLSNGGVAADTISQGADRLQELQARAEMAEASAKLWEADALRYANNTEFWQSRAQKAEAALAAAVDGVIDGGNCREKMLYIHVPGDARGHMMGQPVKVILPAIDAAMKESIEVPDSVSIEARNPTGGVE